MLAVLKKLATFLRLVATRTETEFSDCFTETRVPAGSAKRSRNAPAKEDAG